MLRSFILMAPEGAPASGGTPATPPAAPGAAPAGAPPAAPAGSPPAAPAGTTPPAKQDGTLLTQPPKDGSGDGSGKPGESAPADIKITVPQGFAVDQKRLDGFVAFAKENKISQEAAQKFFDGYVQQQQADVQAAQQRHAETVTQWAEESRKEFGKDFDATIGNAKRALGRFGSPELTELLTSSGLGNHKAVIKAFAQAGEKIAEDRLPAGHAPVSGKPTEEERLRQLYNKSPEMFSK